MVVAHCVICNKHHGLEPQPPGGYIHEGAHWLVCHAPVHTGPLGTLFIESRRHVLDFGELNEEEARAFGPLARHVYLTLRSLTDAERVYQLSMMEGIPHFHAWIIPRPARVAERGVAFLAKDAHCTEQDARQLAGQMREAMRRLC